MRIETMKRLILSCNPEGGVICEVGSGRKCISHGIKCKKSITIDMDSKANPDIIHDITRGIPLPDESVDIIVAGEILEHIYNSREFVQEIRRVLKRNGYLILSCPNICSLRYRLAFLIGRIPAHAARADRTYDDGRPGHLRDYNFREVRDLLEGFKIISEKTDSRLPRTLGNSVIIKAQVIKYPS